MFQRDYILRMIEQMTEIVATISGLKRQHKQALAFDMIDDLLGRYFRMNSQLLNTLSEKDILAMLKLGNFIDPERIVSLARLLKEEADLYESLHRPEEIYKRHIKAFQLALAAAEQDEDPIDLSRDLIEELSDALKHYRLPREITERLFLYYEKVGQYSKAEDQLFDVLESAPNVTEAERIIGEGIQFYDRLLVKDNDVLERGKLPRSELAEGLADLGSRHFKH
ncbi:MAG: hypothetical protein H7X86_12870 [Gorillibacterium sp.]|nr:hypothetical protein [Gorillibacterium sp.]